METWKSPRKVEEEIREYQRKRFEDYMELADVGMISRELAIRALRDEVEIDPELTLPFTPEDVKKPRWDDPDRFDVFGTDD